MIPRIYSAQLLQRAALLLALICFWISGPVATHHTDAPLLFSVGHSAFRHAAPPAAETPCTACEWEQALSHPPATAIMVASLPLVRMRYAAALPAVLHLHGFDYTALRGPPAPLS